ncbi:MAG: hypothetical protein V4634_15110 [Pseudomonadota bacterium]
MKPIASAGLTWQYICRPSLLSLFTSMKLIACFSFCLFACVTAFAEQEPSYIGKGDCRVVNSVPKANEDISWSGPCKDGFAEGVGVLQWFLDGKPGTRYEGNLSRGEYDGPAVTISSKGNRFEGVFKDGKRQGKSILKYANGDVLIVTFEDGKEVEPVEFTFRSGTIYKGGWKNGMFEGKGILTRKDDFVYQGDFKEGRLDGMGTTTYANGAQYEGAYKEGFFEGRGRLIRKDKSVYEGDFKKGEFDGVGVITFQDGRRYEGNLKAGRSNGHGVYTYEKGTKRFEGEFKDGVSEELNKLLNPRYTLKAESPGVGSSVKQDIATSGIAPFDKPYSELTPEQKNNVRAQYEHMEEGDEPPLSDQWDQGTLSVIS